MSYTHSWRSVSPLAISFWRASPLAAQWSRSVGTGLSSVMGSDLIHTCEIGKEKSRDDWRTFGIVAASSWSCRSEPNHWGVVDRADEPVLQGWIHSPPCLFWRSRPCSTCHLIPLLMKEKEQESQWPAQGLTLQSYSTSKVFIKEKSKSQWSIW